LEEHDMLHDPAERARLLVDFAKQLETFDAVLGRLHAFVYQFDRDGRFLYASQPLLDLLGLPLDRVLGRTFFELPYPTELATLLHEQIQQTVQTAQAVDGETVYTSPAGVTGFYEYTFVPLLGAGGTVESVGGHTRDVTERKRAESALKASEARYRTLFESMDQGFCILQMIFDGDQRPVDYRFVETNAVFQQQTGLTDAIGKTARQLVPNLEPYWFAIYGKVALSGAPMRFVNHSEPMGRWFDVYAFRIGEPQELQVALLFNDITMRKRRDANLTFLAAIADDFARLATADEIMQVVGARLGKHLRATACTFCEIDESADVLTVNYEWRDKDAPSLTGTYRITDYFGEELRGVSRAGESVVILDTQSDPRTNPAAFSALAIQSFISVPFHHNKEWKYLLCILDARPRDWSEDEIEVFQDVANRLFTRIERARAETALRESEERFRAIVSQATAGIAQVDLTGRFLLVNDRYCGIVGRSREELLSLTMQRITHPDDLPGNLKLFQGAAETGEPFVIEKRYVRPDGTFVWVSNSVSLVRDANGTPQSVIAITHDVSKRVQAEENLRHSNEALQTANRELEQFAYAAAHDLQEPLRMVGAHTELLLRRHIPESDTRAAKLASFIQTGVRRMEALVRDLLAYSRAVHDEGRGASLIPLDAALDQALDILGRRISEAGAVVDREPLPSVRGDAAQLVQVFQNLISNSLKYVRADGKPEIKIRLQQHDTDWVVAVEDNGIGFEQMYADRIFGLFKRLHRDEYPGTGVGLGICRRIVERHGGRIWAEGRPGEGATFYFSLPRVDLLPEAPLNDDQRQS
jgi:PAS domain S-box-containing protein